MNSWLSIWRKIVFSEKSLANTRGDSVATSSWSTSPSTSMWKVLKPPINNCVRSKRDQWESLFHQQHILLNCSICFSGHSHADARTVTQTYTLETKGNKEDRSMKATASLEASLNHVNRKKHVAPGIRLFWFPLGKHSYIEQDLHWDSTRRHKWESKVIRSREKVHTTFKDENNDCHHFSKICMQLIYEFQLALKYWQILMHSSFSWGQNTGFF